MLITCRKRHVLFTDQIPIHLLFIPFVIIVSLHLTVSQVIFFCLKISFLIREIIKAANPVISEKSPLINSSSIEFKCSFYLKTIHLLPKIFQVEKDFFNFLCINFQKVSALCAYHDNTLN